MISRILALALIFALTCAVSCLQQSREQAGVLSAVEGPIQVESGYLTGIHGNHPGVTVYRGIPYAAPPVGNWRWRPPQPPVRWSGVRSASQFGAVCPQQHVAGAVVRDADEDCLNLDIWTVTAAARRDTRPVMVWLHGAGWAGSDPLFDGEALVLKGITVVTVNYRVGALGFLSTSGLSQESENNSSGNYGLLDAIAALRWVRTNIQEFGGDPTNVTVFGESFGAGMVNFLLLSPLADGLFQRAIMQSHVRAPRDPELFRVATGYQSKATAEANGAEFMQSMGVQSLGELRALSWQQIAEAKGGFAKSIDGWVVPLNYSDTFSRGTQNSVPVLAGSNLDESGAQPASAFDLLSMGASPTIGGPGPVTTLAAYWESVRRKFGAMAEEFMKLYPASNDREAFISWGNSIRDNHRISTWYWSQAYSRKAPGPVYLYLFTHAPPGRDHDLMGVYHGSEVNYVFGHLHPPGNSWTEQDERIADMLSSYWTNFARTGDPNGDGLPEWPAFDPAEESIMEIGDRFGPARLAVAKKVEFWRRFYVSQPES